MSLAQKPVRLNKSLHDTKAFDCGKESMNKFLKQSAARHMKDNLSTTEVIIEEGHPGKAPIVAYYTLAPATVKREEIPAEKSLPAYPIPVIMLARLAVDKNYAGKGLGKKLLVYILRKCYQISQKDLPYYAVILDVLDNDALAFYQSFNFFRAFPGDPMKLFVNIKSLKDL